MTRAEARERKKLSKEARKFGTKDNKELTGLEEEAGGEDEAQLLLQPTSSRSVARTRHTHAPRAGLHYRVGLFLTVCSISPRSKRASKKRRDERRRASSRPGESPDAALGASDEEDTEAGETKGL